MLYNEANQITNLKTLKIIKKFDLNSLNNHDNLILTLLNKLSYIKIIINHSIKNSNQNTFQHEI